MGRAPTDAVIFQGIYRALDEFKKWAIRTLVKRG
jgi:hypothetical protein